jgi:hypothetical protein
MKTGWIMIGLALPLSSTAAAAQMATGSKPPRAGLEVTVAPTPDHPLPPSTAEMRRTHKGPLSTKGLKPVLVRRAPADAAAPDRDGKRPPSKPR